MAATGAMAEEAGAPGAAMNPSPSAMPARDAMPAAAPSFFTLADLCLTDPGAALAYFRGEGLPDGMAMTGGAHTGHISKSLGVGLGSGSLAFLVSMLGFRLRERRAATALSSRPDDCALLSALCYIAVTNNDTGPDAVVAEYRRQTGRRIDRALVEDWLNRSRAGKSPPDVDALAELLAEVPGAPVRIMQGSLALAWLRGEFSLPALRFIGELADALSLGEDEVADLFESATADPTHARLAA